MNTVLLGDLNFKCVLAWEKIEENFALKYAIQKAEEHLHKFERHLIVQSQG